MLVRKVQQTIAAYPDIVFRWRSIFGHIKHDELRSAITELLLIIFDQLVDNVATGIHNAVTRNMLEPVEVATRSVEYLANTRGNSLLNFLV